MKIDFPGLLFPRRCPIATRLWRIRENWPVISAGPDFTGCVRPGAQRCGKPLVAHEQEYCGDCSRKQHEFHKGRAAFVYDETMRRSIAKFKYEGRQEYAAFYADEILKTCAREVMGWNAEAFVPIPLHSARRRKRGYNQAELLARELSGRSGIPVDKSLLIRTKNTRAQKELSDQERKANLKHAFSVREKRIPYKK